MRSAEARIEGHGRAVDYYEAHYQDLLAQYPDQWIAILNQKVVGASCDAFKLMSELEAGGIPANEVLIPFRFERAVKPSFPRRREPTPWPHIYGGITVTWY